MTLSFGPVVERLAYAYPLTQEDVAFFFCITGDEARIEEACKAVALGFPVYRVQNALRYGEVRTCEQMVAWMRAHPTYQ